MIGASGSGKSTLSRQLAEKLGIPHIELDALQHGENWVPRPTFEDDVAAATAADAWVLDGNYSRTWPLYIDRVDTVVWVDPPRHRVMRQVMGRTARRLFLRVELWNGNRERASTLLRASHPIRWAWTTHAKQREGYPALLASPELTHATSYRLQTRAEVRAFLESATLDA